MKDGLTARLTKSGLPVLRVHYTADARKDPSTTEGKAWLVEASQGYPQGLQDPAWRKEMEIEYGAMGGQALFGLWDYYKPIVVIPPFPIENEPYVKFYGSYDHGWIHPAVYQVHAVLPDGRKFTVWEFAGSMVPPRAIAEIIKGGDVKIVQDGRVFPGNPYAGKEIVKVADPQIFARIGRLTDDPFDSIGDLFRDKYGVTFQKGHKGGELTVAEWLIGDLWLDPDQPRYQIFNTCKHLIAELPRLRYRQSSAMQTRLRDIKEQLVDKDNDSWDTLCQFLRLFPSTVAPKAAKHILGTFAYWQKTVKTKKPFRNTYSRV